MDEDLKVLLEEHLAPLGPIQVRRMFGGAGVFLDGLMFGLVSDGVLYLKVDDRNRPVFEAEGLGPFVYEKLGKPATLTSYRQAPERLLDEPDEMLAWARDALAAARRGQRTAAAAARRRKVPSPRSR